MEFVLLQIHVFEILRKEGVRIAYSCSGEGICAQCVLTISPAENVTPQSNMERERKKANRIKPDLRIVGITMDRGAAMQASILAGQPVEVDPAQEGEYVLGPGQA